ncbi:MAG: ABC transporter substrate-binding protein [Clostridia bacterium]|nr:ABC transporter substrate-binding protein [Clostridia bacterium]MBR2603112.1 ABC transporter substrate-binding protein [Clostridia bacterium]MBR7175186.1 ABC transporter substrate-binding protein [Clostridia bacterium]
MKKLVALMLALTLCLSVFAFAGAEEPITLKIAHIGPLTGAAAVYGTATSRGAKIAADEISAAGGKYKVEIIDEDDTHDAEKAVYAYGDALDKGAQMIIGTTTTTPCIAVGAEAFNDRVFMLTPSASSTAVTADKDNVYQVCFTDPAQGAASAEYIAGKKLATKVAVIYNNADAYSTGIYQTFAEKAPEVGLEIVSTTTFTDDTTDFSVQVADAKNNGAELVFLPIYYTPASQILLNASSIDYKPVFFGVDGMDGILSIEGFDTSLAEGVMLLTPFSADAQDELTKNFVAKYQELYNEIPNQFAADAYDGVYALVAAAEKVGVKEGDKPEDICDGLIAAMQEIEITGVTGTMTWAANGEVSKTPTAVIIENGVYVGFGN